MRHWATEWVTAEVLPLHIKKGSAAKAPLHHINDIIELDRTNSPQFLHLWRSHYRFFTSWVAETLRGCAIEDNSSLSDTEVAELLDALIVERVPAEEMDTVGGGLVIFTVDEAEKNRRRLIRWTKVLNEMYKVTEPVHFPELADLIENARLHQAASVFDIAGMFDAMQLQHDTRNAHAFRHNGAVYRLCTVPTGQRHACGLAHLITSWIVRDAEQLGLADVWVDNVRIRHDVARDPTATLHTRLVRAAYARAESLGFVFNEPLQTVCIPTTVYTFVGMDFNHDTVKVSAKTTGKLNQAKDWISVGMTYEEALKTFGVMLHTERVMRVTKEPAAHYYILKNLRRLARSNTHFGAAGVVWPSIIKQWRDWMNRLLRAPPRKIHQLRPPTNMTLVVDASLEGFGAWFFDDTGGLPAVIGAAWPQWLRHMEPNIAELEILAIAMGIALYQRNDKQKSLAVHVISDNTTALAGCRRGTLRNYFQNRALLYLQEALSSNNMRITQTSYIRSERNPADIFSRLPQLLKQPAAQPATPFTIGVLQSGQTGAEAECHLSHVQ